MPPLTRGPLPARVYWRRRMLLIGLAVLLVVGIARILGAGSDASSEPEARQAAARTTAGSSSPATTGPAVPTVTVTAGGQGQGKHGHGKHGHGKRGGSPAPVLAEPDGPCEVTDIEVSPEVKDAVGGPSGGTRVKLQLQTRSAEACTWHASARNLTMKITSGHDDIWSSRQCPRAIPEQDVVVRREVPTTLEVTWDGRRSDDGCPRTTGWALPGWYHVTVAAMGGEPADSQFELQAPSAPVITRTPEPTQSPDGGKHHSKHAGGSSGSGSD